MIYVISGSLWISATALFRWARSATGRWCATLGSMIETTAMVGWIDSFATRVQLCHFSCKMNVTRAHCHFAITLIVCAMIRSRVHYHITRCFVCSCIIRRFRTTVVDLCASSAVSPVFCKLIKSVNGFTVALNEIFVTMFKC